ncbi:DNA-3-methyladenine glycosylase [Prochlorococcus sp. MIT 1341]|uniref:DNA-3-methyladenine glycosylase n=1 Tax=Prochlorococcus sp. MIT 1341 TaxID=3096221 RepID=UPI002A75A2FD|nr:DNA-3-methyladenine glycosylase [Prochlorococcus sp. MIT 1341]
MSANPKTLEERLKVDNVIPLSFFSRPAEIVAPDLIGCKLVKRQSNGEILWGVIVETEAYCQSEPSCHGFNRRSASNETLFGLPGHLYIYLTYGIYHCVNVVTDKPNWASGVLLRALALPNEDERIASGPGLLAKRFELNRSHDNLPLLSENNIWIAFQSLTNEKNTIVRTTRIGISKAESLPYRWYLKESRSVSKRAKGDHCPNKSISWKPSLGISHD